MQAIVLAVGSGKRMLPLTQKIPPCFLEVNRETVLIRIINQLLHNNLKDISVVVGYKREKIMSEIKKK